MPRVRRKGHALRNPEAPLPEWSTGDLSAELERLEENPEGLNAWQIFKRRSEIENELHKRGVTCRE
jgi:hypothetical protein